MDLLDETLSSVWRNDFTVDNFIDYARASRDLSSYIRVLYQEGFKHLVIPSRGAVPFINAASSAWRLEARGLPTYEERLQHKISLLDSPFLQKLVLPFSADPQDQTQTTAAIRKYWSRVLAAIVKRDGTNVHLSFYKNLVDLLAKESWHGALPRDLPGEKFLFVDTVVSGRAICEIVAAFEEVGLDQCHFLLIADGNGDYISPKYRRVIDELRFKDRCTLIPVSRLFTEDRGPAVSGVWSTVYPQLLDILREKYEWAQDSYGAGTFYHRVSSSQDVLKEGIGNPEFNMPVTRMYAAISTGIFTALGSLHEMAVINKKTKSIVSTLGYDVPDLDSIIEGHRVSIEASLRSQLRFQLHYFRKDIEEMQKFSPLDKETTRLLAEPRILAIHPNAEVDVSSSHLVRVNLPNDAIEAFMRNADRELRARRDVLADDWFRR